MKAVIVIDMPTKCGNCLLVEEWFNEYGEKTYYCPLHRASISKNGDVCKKIRPLPRKMSIDGDDIEEDSYFTGWNECLDEIVGDN